MGGTFTTGSSANSSWSGWNYVASDGIGAPTGKLCADGKNWVAINTIQSWASTVKSTDGTAYGSSSTIYLVYGSASTGALKAPSSGTPQDLGTNSTNYWVVNGGSYTVKHTITNLTGRSIRFYWGGSGTLYNSQTNPLKNGTLYTIIGYDDAPNAPVTSSSSVTNSNTVSIAWNVPTDDGGTPITGYRLQYSTSSSFSSNVTTVNQTTRSWSGNLAYGTRYYFRIAAKNAVTDGASPATTSVYGTTVTLTTLPATPTNLRTDYLEAVSTPRTPTSVALDWDGDTTGVTRYRVSYKKSSDSVWTDTGYSGLTSSYKVTGLLSNTAYDFRVSAENSTYSTTSGYATLTNISTLPGPKVYTTSWSARASFNVRNDANSGYRQGTVKVWDGVALKWVDIT